MIFWIGVASAVVVGLATAGVLVLWFVRQCLLTVKWW